jgi:hypothetical protein
VLIAASAAGAQEHRATRGRRPERGGGDDDGQPLGQARAGDPADGHAAGRPAAAR